MGYLLINEGMWYVARCVLIPAPYLPHILNNTRDVMEMFLLIVNKSDVGFSSYNTSAHRPI